MRLIAGSLLLLLALNVYSQESSVEAKIRSAMSADIRSESDTARDRNRRPVETLAFFQLRDDMRVLELLPGGGWYTKILAPVLRDNGEMYVAIGTNSIRDKLMRQDGFGDINVIDVDIDTDEDGVYDDEDECLDTIIPESVPTNKLGTNRFALVDEDMIFDTESPKGKGPQASFTIEDTAGCSCEQIIDELGLGKGHTKFGCSISAMDDWVNQVNQ